MTMFGGNGSRTAYFYSLARCDPPIGVLGDPDTPDTSLASTVDYCRADYSNKLQALRELTSRVHL